MSFHVSRDIFCVTVLAVLLAAGLESNGTAQTTTQTPSSKNVSLGDMGALNGWVPSPNDAWHQDITNAPLDPTSSTIINTSGDLASEHLHPDFGSYFGIPYTVVDSSVTPLVPVTPLWYVGDSDVTLYPMTPTTPIEGNPGPCPTDGNDRHAIVIDRNTGVDYELFQASYCNSQWTSSSNALWDFTETENRPYSLTSADAAGLSIFEGLIRYDEILAGSINHAIRFTATFTKNDANGGYYTAPATHAAGNNWGTGNIIGMRIRLNANFDISGFSPTNQIILKAMKQYGMILADNGGTMFFQGTPDPRWNDNDLDALKAIPSSAFEVVKMAPAYDSATAPTGNAPQIASFTASQTNVAPGTPVVLTPIVTGASYSYVDLAGFTRGPITVTPSATTTYNLTSRNAFGTSTTPVTVTVQGGSSKPTLAFTAIPAQTYGATPFTVSATSNSSGAITYSVVSGPATLSGSKITLNGTGTVTLKASQAAAGSYPSATATISFNVNGATPTLTFASIPDQTYGAAPVTISATSNSSGAITYSVVSGPATISGNTVNLTNTGRVTLIANQAAIGNFATGTATISFNVNGTIPTLAFAAIPSKAYGAAPFTVAATSNSSGAITYSVVSGPATIAGSTITVTGIGAVTLRASQAAAGNYTSATATSSFNINAATPSLTFAAIPSQLHYAVLTLSATSNSSGVITYSVVSGPATIAGDTITVTGAGTVTVQASQAAAGGYTSATATASFAVSPSSSATGDFILPTNVPAITILPGQSENLSIDVTSVNGFAGTISFNCNVPQVMGTASCSATSVQLSNSSKANSKITLTTMAPTTLVSRNRGPVSGGTEGFVFLGVLAPFGLPLWRRRRRMWGRLALSIAFAATLVGCGSSIQAPITPPGTYAVVVTATSGAISHEMTLTVIVK
jgi:hypothetical protein